ncbi:DUF1816 domain-containing protein [Geitlerinema sp. PCC 9228]|jgi:hypothetical protein|uniref:DUF1816 domain-containing protein n=1 Tax=Geitlerinema sp. PCC 9228 TaxID=111611 RepID=UPI0008F9D9EA|nr:DUF1816 domain-containing protein [Geitlerinema sp. PCC 9228]
MSDLKPKQLTFWVKIFTESPQYLYYFGPFVSVQEAQIHQGGYVEDLQGEGAHIQMLEIVASLQPVGEDWPTFSMNQAYTA